MFLLIEAYQVFGDGLLRNTLINLHRANESIVNKKGRTYNKM
jgi:hypothetical protein